jgi:hypothetical protein
MKISQYIRELEAIRDQHGADLEVQKEGWNGRCTAGSPAVSHESILKGRESKQRFWSHHDDVERKGAAVCRV